MIEIRKLTIDDMQEAMKLKALCWPEELGGLSNNRLNIEKEFYFWTKWMNTAEDNNDIRLLFGAFQDDKMLGVAFGSFAEIEDISEYGIELNGLWVYPEYRGKGISLILINKLLSDFLLLGMKQMVIYNLHHSSSNGFYHKLGCKVIRCDTQMKENLPVDVFISDISIMKDKIENSLKKYLK